jgi:hypothetical protein
MISVENCPQCPCGYAFNYWHENVTHSAGLTGRFEIVCPDCKKKVYIKRITKEYFDCFKEGEYASKPVEMEKEMTFWTLLGKRRDGTFYTTGTWEDRDGAIRFRDEHHFDLIAIGEFKGVFKFFDHELKRK